MPRRTFASTPLVFMGRDASYQITRQPATGPVGDAVSIRVHDREGNECLSLYIDVETAYDLAIQLRDTVASYGMESNGL